VRGGVGCLCAGPRRGCEQLDLLATRCCLRGRCVFPTPRHGPGKRVGPGSGQGQSRDLEIPGSGKRALSGDKGHKLLVDNEALSIMAALVLQILLHKGEVEDRRVKGSSYKESRTWRATNSERGDSLVPVVHVSKASFPCDQPSYPRCNEGAGRVYGGVTCVASPRGCTIARGSQTSRRSG
jgi:hypothetical protein